MATIPEETDTPSISPKVPTNFTLADKVKQLEKQLKLKQMTEETTKNSKPFKWPFKWKRKFNAAKRKNNNDLMLVMYLNKKNQVEIPKFMPIFDGNMVVYKNKPYEFDPRAIWTIKGVKGNPTIYILKEIDRRPVRNKNNEIIYKDAAVSNQDLGEIRERGDSTESDEFLIKAALKAQTAQVKKNMNYIILAIIGVIVIGGIIWFLSSK